MKKLCDMSEPELKELLNQCAYSISERTGSLYMLVIFDEPNLAQYISNANRHSCIEAMRETADRLENKEIIER